MSSVYDFGAVGDGSADDTDALQHAIDTGDGLVELPRGDYRITRPLQIDLGEAGRTGITGRGGGAKLIMAGPGPAVRLLGHHGGSAAPASFQPQVWQKERMPTVDGLEIEGAHEKADGISIEGAVQVTLTRVLIREVRTAVHATQRTRNLLISNCHFFHNTGVGVHLDRVNLHQCIISSSHISYSRLGGIRIENSEIRNLQITGNDIEYNNVGSHADKFPEAEGEPTAEIYIDVGEGSVREGTICSNTIQATVTPNGCNIYFAGAERQDDLAGLWTITGNLIGNQETNIHLLRAWGVVISGNQIYGATRRNILVEKSRNVVIGANMLGHTPDFNAREIGSGVRLEDSHGCIVSGLQVQDSQGGEQWKPPYYPKGREALVEVVRCRRINLTGCQILDGTPTGLLLEDCADSSVNNCQIFDQRAEPQMEVGIRVRGDSQRLVLSHCQIGGATGQAIQGTPHPGLTVMDNVTS